MGGVIVERSPGSLADALDELSAEPAAARALGERGRRWVLEHLEPGRLGSDYERLYAEVAATRRPRDTAA